MENPPPGRLSVSESQPAAASLSACNAYHACMTEVTISARIPRELAKELERLMREEHLEKSAALRKLLHLGLKDYRLDRALAELSKGRISLSRAAEEAGVSVWELIDEAARHRVTWVADDVIDDTHGRRRK